MRYSINYFVGATTMRLPSIFIVSFLTVMSAIGLEAQNPSYFEVNGKKIHRESFQEQVLEMMENLRIPGASLAVIDRNEVVFYEPFGIKKLGEKEEVNPKTVFAGCSLSKSYLVYFVMKLVDEGKLKLDKPIYKYLKNDRLKHDKRYKLITPRMILSHASGLENWQDLNRPDTLEILTDPGQNYNYSGEGYNYLAGVIEHLLQQAYEDYIEERVLNPLELHNSYVKYRETIPEDESSLIPQDYATGHTVFGDYELSMNFFPSPASGNHFTAEDYAKLIIGIFDTTRLSVDRINDLKQPLAKLSSNVKYGPGFLIIQSETDTIIAQGGDNPGYKNWLFYSVVHASGVVYMTNSDNGELMTAKLCEMLGLNIDPFLDIWDNFNDQYPSRAIELFHTYIDEGEEEMFTKIERAAEGENVSVGTLNTLTSIFLNGYEDLLAEKLINYNLALYPDNCLAYLQLAQFRFSESDFQTAIDLFKKAKECGYDNWEINSHIQRCQRGLKDIERRKDYLFKIDDGQDFILQAENFNHVKGKIWIFPTEDPLGAGKKIGYYRTGDWLSYQIDVAKEGQYEITCMISSHLSNHRNGDNMLEIYIGDQLLTEMKMGLTDDWDRFMPFTSKVSLPKGVHTIKFLLKNGDVNIDRIKFSSR